MNLYKSKNEIIQEMLDDYKGITGETLNINDLGYEEVIKMHTYAGAMSSFYADLSKSYNDIHPQDASIDGLIKHLKSRGLPDRIQPQKAVGNIQHTGTTGESIPVGTRISRDSDGRLFDSTENAVFDENGEAVVSYQSVLKGQENNIQDTGIEFSLVSALPDIDSEAVSTSSFTGARNVESSAEMLNRILTHDSRENSGGNIPAYEAWAKEASNQVVTARTYRHVRGVGTVDTIITAGTSDIDSAVENGLDILRIPGQELIDTVQAYVVQKDPTTDDHKTYAPDEENFDTTIYYELFDESLRATVDTEIIKIWKKFIYKVIPSQKIYPTDLEQLIDASLSELIKHRRVSDFSVNYYYEVPDRTLLTPNALTLNGGD